MAKKPKAIVVNKTQTGNYNLIKDESIYLFGPKFKADSATITTGIDTADTIIKTNIGFSGKINLTKTTGIVTGMDVDVASDSLITIAKRGAISASTFGINAVTSDGVLTINNGGTIKSTAGTGIQAVNENGLANGLMISNTRSITGMVAGLSVLDDGATITNARTGTISGLTGLWLLDQNPYNDDNIASGEAATTIANSGKITGGTGGYSIRAEDITVHLTNSGTLTGGIMLIANHEDIAQPDANDRITNVGKIDGDIDTGDGNDIVNNRRVGTIKGDVYLGNGNDYFSGVLASGKTIYGGDGNDTYEFRDVIGTIVETANIGEDTIIARGMLDMTAIANVENGKLIGLAAVGIIGNSLDNALRGNSAINIISGAAGNDTIYGGGSNDTLNGDIGNDALFGEAGNDTLNGNTGDDDLYGGLGNDILNGGDGDDTLHGGDGNDILNTDRGNNSQIGNQAFGDDGNDTLNGGLDVDTLHGGNGDDILDGGDAIDHLFGDAGNDTINGDLDDDVIDGGEGNDTLNGGSGGDAIDGGNGNDIMDGGIGGDQLYGGDGDDTLAGNDDDDTVSGENGNDTVGGGNGNDLVYGDEGNDTVSGDSGDDSVSGGNGDDKVNGNDGIDILHGGAGDDTLDGGNGNDTLFGDAGSDTLRGGAGADTFIFVLGDTGLSTTFDTIADFLTGSDQLRFGAGLAGQASGAGQNYVEATGAADYAAAGLAANTALTALNNVSTAAQLYALQQVGTDSYFFIDFNSDGFADGVIKLIGVTAATFAASDIF